MFSDDDAALEPIPANITDIARAMVLRSNKGRGALFLEPSRASAAARRARLQAL